MNDTPQYPSLSDAELANAMLDKTYEYKCVGLWDWRGYRAKGWEAVDPTWPPAGALAAIGWVRRKKETAL